jgi:hypothetical protein
MAVVAMASLLQAASSATLAGLPTVPPSDEDHPRRMVLIDCPRTATGAQFVDDIGFVLGTVERWSRFSRTTFPALNDLVR